VVVEKSFDQGGGGRTRRYSERTCPNVIVHRRGADDGGRLKSGRGVGRGRGKDWWGFGPLRMGVVRNTALREKPAPGPGSYPRKSQKKKDHKRGGWDHRGAWGRAKQLGAVICGAEKKKLCEKGGLCKVTGAPRGPERTVLEGTVLAVRRERGVRKKDHQRGDVKGTVWNW